MLRVRCSCCSYFLGLFVLLFDVVCHLMLVSCSCCSCVYAFLLLYVVWLLRMYDTCLVLFPLFFSRQHILHITDAPNV